MTITEYLAAVSIDDYAAELASPRYNADCRDDKPRQVRQLTVPQLTALLRKACRLLQEAGCSSRECCWGGMPDHLMKHHTPSCFLTRATEFLAKEIET